MATDNDWKRLGDLTERTARAMGYRLVRINKQGAKEQYTSMIFDPNGNAVLPFYEHQSDEPITLKSYAVRDHMKRHYGINLLEAMKYSGGL